MQKIDRNALVSGLLLAALGAFFGYAAGGLATTQHGNMGPGYFPKVLSALLVLLGLCIAGTAFWRRAGTVVATPPPNPLPWRAIVLLSAALLWFALTVRPLGLGIALGGTLLTACMASPKSRLKASIVTSVCMVLFAWGVFIQGLRMPVRMLGTWFY